MKVSAVSWVVLFLFSVSVAQAQVSILVVPCQYSNTLADSSDNAPLGVADQYIQQDYAGSLLATCGVVPGDEISGIGFSIASGEPGLPAQTISDYSIWMGVAAFSPGNMSSTLANNGSDMQLVRSGALTINSGQFAGGSGVNAFGMIQLSTPYTYTGGDLLIEISYSGFATGGDVAAEYPFNSTLAQTAFGTGPDATTANQGLYDEAIVIAFDVTPTPEPAAAAMFACGAFGLCFVFRQRQRPRASKFDR